ncbi:S10 family peptidase [Oleiagrimonas soli]|uniref:Carboxypeptidase C (Cathepsin A) n=1 Tax=Oleiagrimonas soli TaxID=1543381 RepID=A0A099CYW7_9GAMM|nr:peptidase S10 [Oleiagrimonas soli]KGI78220.1 peptidase S10 [Oleiagrimonas soli]MBB6183317.1 carboxypeptidase C (cathepsin A) [Oleiagrimonas soli]
MRRHGSVSMLLGMALAVFLAVPALAAPPSKKDGDGMHLPPFPADAHTTQVTHVAGKTIKYNVTVGSLPVRNDQGKKIAEVMYTAYTVPGGDRPVTFAFNGGPGASSVYLNFGAIGPKKIRFGDEGDNPSDRPTLHDNPGTWLDFTDLVFIDPVGTGFSRSLEPQKQTVKDFYSTDADIHYLSRIVYDWLIKNGRMTSRKYLVGESYGGFRGPRITEYLQTQLGVAMNGVVLVSPYLDPNSYKNGEVSPLPWMLTLPSITAAHLEREGKLTPQAMQKVIDYTRGEYAHALMLGNSNPAERDRMIQRVTEMTGLDPTFVKQSGGRLDTGAYLREVHRSQGKLGSVYDSNLTGWDPFPYAPRQKSNDPMLNAIIAPTTEAMVNFITRTVGWKYDGRYYALSYKVNSLWHEDDDADSGSVKQLREAVANDGKLRVLIAHGWNDLSCPFMGSILVVDQMPKMGDASRVQVREYPGGHMFYTRPDSQKAFRKDVMALFQAH